MHNIMCMIHNFKYKLFIFILKYFINFLIDKKIYKIQLPGTEKSIKTALFSDQLKKQAAVVAKATP